jgi:DNA polymerase-3 subunit epsilon
MILFFDTETTGVPKNYDAPISEVNNWPRLVQLAYIKADWDGNVIDSGDFIIKPDGFKIPIESSKIHGITDEVAVHSGIGLIEVLELLHIEIEAAALLVAHNVKFDKKIIAAEFFRSGINCSILRKPTICTMESSTNFCALPGYKWPKLSELYKKLFGEEFQEQHNARNDIFATYKCFWELNKRGIIKIVKTTHAIQDKVPENVGATSSPVNTLSLNSAYESIRDFCIQKGYAEIPLAAKARAIMNLEARTTELCKRDGQYLTSFDKRSFYEIKKEIICQHGDSFLFTDKNTIVDKITSLELCSIVTLNDSKDFNDITNKLYGYYIERHNDFLNRIAINPTLSIIADLPNLHEYTFDLSNSPVDVVECCKKIEKYIADYDNIFAEISIGNLPKSIYDLVNSCNEALDAIKTRTGTESTIYKELSSKIVRLAATILTDWLEQNKEKNILLVPIKEMSLGNNLLEVFNSTFSQVISIQVDDNCRGWLNEKTQFALDTVKFIYLLDAQRLRSASKTKEACFVATMAYGNYNHPKVIILRRYRDNRLRKSALGRLFIKFYYAISPKIVTLCNDREYIKKTARLFLDYFISKIKIQ